MNTKAESTPGIAGYGQAGAGRSGADWRHRCLLLFRGMSRCCCVWRVARGAGYRRGHCVPVVAGQLLWRFIQSSRERDSQGDLADAAGNVADDADRARLHTDYGRVFLLDSGPDSALGHAGC